MSKKRSITITSLEHLQQGVGPPSIVRREREIKRARDRERESIGDEVSEDGRTVHSQ